jgi:hypothetical protein
VGAGSGLDPDGAIAATSPAGGTGGIGAPGLAAGAGSAGGFGCCGASPALGARARKLSGAALLGGVPTEAVELDCVAGLGAEDPLRSGAAIWGRFAAGGRSGIGLPTKVHISVETTATARKAAPTRRTVIPVLVRVVASATDGGS